MQPPLIPALLGGACATLLLATAPAQVSSETFSAGNPEAWQVWFTPYNYVRTTGGNPGQYLELDNVTSGPATCQFLSIFPDRSAANFNLSHAGNWRAAGVDQVSIDVNILTGPLDGVLTLFLVSDPGTPAIPGDDCILRLSQANPGPNQVGWTTLVFPVDAASAIAPIGWTIDASSGGCIGDLNQVWNTVMQDVDEVRFRYDTTSAFCTFTRWIFGIDNITVGTPGPPAPGVNYCSAAPNSTGAPAAMSASGNSSAAANQLTLACTGMPSNAFGFFLTSATQAFVPNPAGSQGNLCLGGAIGRYVGPGQIQNSGAAGAIGLAVDLTRHPQPTGSVPVLAGQTWHFTCWFRDVIQGAATSNFADGYTIVFS